MIVCANCKKEMTCKKTGSYVRFRDGTHVYPADQFECTECGAVVNVCTGEPFFDPKAVKVDTDVWMD